jgi:transposase
MISMEVFMDIFALRRQGFSLRYIAKKLGVHRKTVKRYLGSGSLPQYRREKGVTSIVDPFKQVIEDFLEHDSYQATWIFDRIKNMGYKGSYDTVKRYVHKAKERLSNLAFIRFETEPGVQAQVDWGDFQVEEPQAVASTIHAFIMILGFSRAMFVEFVKRCDLETFMDCHIHAFRFLKGVPAQILYDNMKHVVISRKAGRVIFNTEFAHFAHHYGFDPKPCPAYSPWVKGKVERPIDYLRERFWRGYVFESIEKTNQDLLAWLNETANERIHGTHREPIRTRWEQEIPQLGTLPATEYDTSIKIYRKVYKDCQISYECNRYVLPHHVVGKRVMLKIKNKLMRIYHDQDLLATYEVPEGKYQVIANPLFYEQLKRDQELLRRKYGKAKGKATRGLTNGSLFPQVEYRPLAVYEQLAQGGAPWNN